ncbi:GMC oxidoreductase [Amycolatopsis lurida]
MTPDSGAHYDVIVIGSGFGGSVAAYRLADAGLHVCLLERGRSYPPGAFPRSPYRMKTNFWDPSEGYYGLYDLWHSREVAGVVASGLGGGSLIFANVLLRKDERTFAEQWGEDGEGEPWPVSRADLDPHYDRVEEVLAPQRYPIELPPYGQAHRARALRDAADTLRLPWFTPELAVTFAAPGRPPSPGEPIPEAIPNLHGRPRETCRLCAECCFGCNYGSKNSLDLNYLTLAQDVGAEIHPLCEVRQLRPHARGYLVGYVRHDLGRAGRATATHDTGVLPQRTITADRVVLAAGTFGSTFLLLKNRAALPGLSDRLGSRFSTNGDFLAIARRCGSGTWPHRQQRVIEADVGPAITGAIEVPGDGGAPSYLEDMGFPAFLAWLLQAADLPNTAGALARLVPRIVARQLGLRDEPDALDGDVATMFGSTGLSAALLPLIGVGRDVPDGRMSLRKGLLHIDWHDRRSEPYFTRAAKAARAVAGALGGRYLDTRTGPVRYGVTMHPLGGCPMGHHRADGVVDPYGEVFGHPGLFVADGSVLPGPVGANPSLTIAALADRTADRILTATGA